ncbi:MAG TPA: hypothetical protein VKB03_08830 [Conexibacter sp.]|nr:hypothetical protein [Conexibacter sp.]
MRAHPWLGGPLPNASLAHSSLEKWTHWILASRGHAEHWQRVFRAEATDQHTIWIAIARAVQMAPVIEIRDQGQGLVCGVLVVITVRSRTAPVMTSWHYDDVTRSAPRLVTAYPTL